MSIRVFAFAVAIAGLGASAAQAEFSISKKPTKNVTCAGGTCTATAKHANLNATDLAAMLASSDVTVASTVKAKDIDITAPLSWANATRLTLDSFQNVDVTQTVSVTGTGAVTITTNDGGISGALTIAGKGSVSFLDISSNLTINGETYVLAADLATLSSDIAANQSGNFALARSYDAGPDGVYVQNPITSVFVGKLEGLGNSIKNLKIHVGNNAGHIGMFYAADTVSDLHLVHIDIKAGRGNVVGALAGLCARNVRNVDAKVNLSAGAGSVIGGLCGESAAMIANSHSTGAITGKGDANTGQSDENDLGGLVGFSEGAIAVSYSAVKVLGAKGWTSGGLVGETTELSAIEESYATGNVFTGDNGVAGGLIGNNAPMSGATATGNSYATGFVDGGVSSTVGGFIGLNSGPVIDSYSSGGVVSGSGNAVGGFIGNDTGPSDLTDTYFDIDTSGQSHGVGNNTGYPGVTGLTNAQFQAGLPEGFDPGIWTENPDINGGLPYLLALPPG